MSPSKANLMNGGRLRNVKKNMSKIVDGKNLSLLLLKGLKEKDQKIMKALSCIKEEKIIRAARGLPHDIVDELIGELKYLLDGKKFSS